MIVAELAIAADIASAPPERGELLALERHRNGMREPAFVMGAEEPQGPSTATVASTRHGRWSFAIVQRGGGRRRYDRTPAEQQGAHGRRPSCQICRHRAFIEQSFAVCYRSIGRIHKNTL